MVSGCKAAREYHNGDVASRRGETPTTSAPGCYPIINQIVKPKIFLEPGGTLMTLPIFSRRLKEK
jgi:hypothetical protein